MEQPEVGSFCKDARFEGFLLVRSAEKRTSSNGGPYLDMILADVTGEINAKVWNTSAEAPATGSVLRIRGLVTEYNGRLQLRVDRYRARTQDDDVDLTLLVPSAPTPPEQMRQEVDRTVRSMKNPVLRALTTEMLALTGDRLDYYPAAQRLHHAERSGLLHHITSMLRAAEAVLPCYAFLDGDLVRAGVIVHDLAKVFELQSDLLGNVADYTKEGILIGHLVRGVALVREAAARVEIDPSEEYVTLLEHLIISHHGLAEYGSPRPPMFPEAEMLHWLDVLDARMTEMSSVLRRTPPGVFSEKIWSLDRRLYHPVYFGQEKALPDPVQRKDAYDNLL